MRLGSVNRNGGAALALAAACVTQAVAQDPHSASQTSVVQRIAPDSGHAASATGRTRELVCRGKPGIDLRIHEDPSPRDPRLVTMALRYDRVKEVHTLSQQGMVSVDNGRSIQFIPGSCTWGYGAFPEIPLEPRIVYFDLPRDAQAHAPGQRDTSAAAAALYPDVLSLPLYLSDSSRYWLFYVDDLTNVSISFRSSEIRAAEEPVASVTGSLRDTSLHSATLSSARVLPGAGSVTVPRPAAPAPGPAPSPAPSPTRSVGGPLRGTSPATATTTVARPLPTDSAARRTATVRTPTPKPTSSVEGPLREPSSGIATPGAGALPADSAARRTATARTPVAPTVGGPLRGTSPGGAQPATSRAKASDTAAKVPDAARARSPQLQVNRVYDVRTEPGPLGVRLTFQATGAGTSGNILGLSTSNPAGGIVVEISGMRPTWNERERLWAYPDGFQGPWASSVRAPLGGGFVAEPLGKLEHGELYYYLITVWGSDPSAPPAQRTGSFRADVRTPLRDLVR